MDIFQIHSQIINEYKSYISSFLKIKDERIHKKVQNEFESGSLWPDPLIQFNPSFEKGLSIKELCDDNKGILHPELKNIFKGYELYYHQVEALKLGAAGKGFVVTSGTGSGKSLTYIGTIFNSILKNPSAKGIKAVIVYPMNALINSQWNEIDKYQKNFERENPEKQFKVTFAKYTGQEDQLQREEVRKKLPDILLTNYMMLELIMTRSGEEEIRESLKEHLQFMVFDELHTYRGRQGADVAMLIRRIQAFAKNKEITCIGTSATMITGGTLLEQQITVSEVATKFFSKRFEPVQIVIEKLTLCTSGDAEIPIKNDLVKALESEIKEEDSANDFVHNKLAIWLERKIATQLVDQIIQRGDPKTLTEIVALLESESGIDQKLCEAQLIKLLSWAEKLNIKAIEQRSRESFLPFKLHQFISQTGSVYVTLEDRANRNISIEPGPTVKIEGIEKFQYPVVTSRSSGYDFVCVRKDYKTNKLLPREFFDMPYRPSKEEWEINDGKKKTKKPYSQDNFTDGYIILPYEDEEIWQDELIEFLPESWLKHTKSGLFIDDFYEFQLPQPISIDDEGNFSDITPTVKPKAWFVTAPLLLDPTSGVIFDRKASETSKLMKLGNEGRSTSTTITSLEIIKALQHFGTPTKEQKVLSFTDNRQDASLQAGHFNDFILVIRLRSALYQALLKSSEQLNIDNIALEVAKQLNLSEEEYASRPSSPDWPDEENIKALREYLTIRILGDLKKGWRFNLPNLEQCALLKVDYYKLNEFIAIDDFWKDVPLLGQMNPADRLFVVTQVLNYFRTSFAFSNRLLKYDVRKELENRLKTRLDPDKLWSLDQDENIDAPYYLVIDAVGRAPREIFTASVGSNSNLGKFIKYIFKKNNQDPPKGDEYKAVIRSILEILFKGNFLIKEEITGERGKTTGYQLRTDKILWTKGDLKNAARDYVRNISYKDLDTSPNEYFQQLYRYDYNTFIQQILGREHTGQINNEQRIEREKQFSDAVINALFCSPTMELGIDISTLNVVHMRNVPPNPSNYVQRSGRAGRSGQTALVITYCSDTSPHDRHYFKNKAQMVSGRVYPPKIDLTNKELIYAHLNATFLTYANFPEFTHTLADLIEFRENKLPLKLTLRDTIKHHNENSFMIIKGNFLEVITDIDLVNTLWFTEKWIDNTIKEFEKNLDDSMTRWRKLFNTAQFHKNEADKIISDPIIKSDSIEKKTAQRRRFQAEQQRNLLLNNTERNNTLSEFYTYRYFASEGFLPGYNFTRLPIRTYLGGKEKQEYISRPRTIALKEFGPNNIIYHNGGKFRINRAILTDVVLKLHKLTISNSTNYAYFDEENKGVNNDPINNKPMTGNNLSIISNLLEMSETSADSVERISCEEEVRTTEGFTIDSFLNIPMGLENARKIYLRSGTDELMKLIYSPAANIYSVNKKWKTSKKEDGFPIGQATGFWKKQKDLEKPNQNDLPVTVQLFTSITTDILYIQPVEALELSFAGIISILYAIKRAVEQMFLVEPNEIGALIMGKDENSNIMLFEASEGSLGVLSQLAEDGDLLKQVFQKVYEICGFDPLTNTDINPERVKASYDDLLSYYNQIHHNILDRHSIKAALEALMSCEVDNTQGTSYEEQYQSLKKGIHPRSNAEKTLLEYLYNKGLRLPDFTNKNMEEYFIQPDFIYMPNHLVFCDGGIHKKIELMTDDLNKRSKLENAGFDVISWDATTEKIEDLMKRRKDIFRKVK